MNKVIIAAAFSTACLAAPALAQSTDDAERYRIERVAQRTELVYLGLSAADLALTLNCLDKRTCVEDNPIYGQHPKAGRLIAVKLIGGAIHYTMFRIALHENPRFALRMAQVSVGVQGGITALNVRFAFK